MLQKTPERSIILLEDIDAAFVDRKAAEKRGNHVTFSGLLNAIDGVAAHEGRILFLTTNHKEKIAPALIRYVSSHSSCCLLIFNLLNSTLVFTNNFWNRPGRVDKQVLIGLAHKDQIRRMFLHFYNLSPKTAAPEDTPELTLQLASSSSGSASKVELSEEEIKRLAQEFADKIPDEAVSMASLQSHFLDFKFDPIGALEAVDKLLEAEKKRQAEDLEQKKKEQEKKKKDKKKKRAKKADYSSDDDGEGSESAKEDQSGKMKSLDIEVAKSVDLESDRPNCHGKEKEESVHVLNEEEMKGDATRLDASTLQVAGEAGQ